MFSTLLALSCIIAVTVFCTVLGMIGVTLFFDSRRARKQGLVRQGDAELAARRARIAGREELLEEQEAAKQAANDELSCQFSDWTMPAEDEKRHAIAREAAFKVLPKVSTPDRVSNDPRSMTPNHSVYDPYPYLASLAPHLPPPVVDPSTASVPLAASRESHAVVAGILTDPALTPDAKAVVNQAADELGEDVVAKLAQKDKP